MNDSIVQATVQDNSSNFPTLGFTLPKSVFSKGFSYAIFGNTSSNGKPSWQYWDASKSSYTDFGSASPNTACLNAAPETSFQVALPTDTSLKSGVVVLFLGTASGIPVSGGVPSTPTPATNPDDHFGIFEVNYTDPAAGQSLDVDISNVDQIGLTFTVTSSSAPYPMGEVGIPLSQADLIGKYETTFDNSSPFRQCLHTSRKQLVAPQDILEAVKAPAPFSYLAPGGTPPESSTPFLEHCYFYAVSETSPSGETAASPAVFGGFLLSSKGKPQAKDIRIGWQKSGDPAAYSPLNPQATGLRIYRAAVPALNEGSKVPKPPPASAFGLLTSMTIADWNKQPNLCYVDDAAKVAHPDQHPKSSSYGFSSLSTWFDTALQAFFAHYKDNTFWTYQTPQAGTGSNGTLWTGKVLEVTPQSGKPITTQKYMSHTGDPAGIDATWKWGAGDASFYVLQLVGNAYDQNDLSKYALSTGETYAKGEYEGAVVNIYFPYFQENTGLSKLAFPKSSDSYALPAAPSWMTNASWSPSHQVFGCSGVFATVNDPDAVAQQTAYPKLAKNALTNLENVIVSALNRGIATGQQGWLAPMQYTCLYQFSEPARVGPGAGKEHLVPPGHYTYALAGVLQDGSETALTWSETVTVSPIANYGVVTLSWLPLSPNLYKAVKVYRQEDGGPFVLVGTVQNSAGNMATGFTDTNRITLAPIIFYPDFYLKSRADDTDRSNHYSAFLHQNITADASSGVSINGLCYGFPFDDQGNFSTNINYGSALPEKITVAVQDY